MKTSSLLFAVTLCLLAGACSRSPQDEAASSARKPLAAPHAAIGNWGFDTAGMDTRGEAGR